MVAALFGLNTGSYQAFTRTIYSTLIPYGREAEYFSFYEVSDKGTAWLGPLVLAMVNDATGSFRTAFVYLEIFFVVGLFLLYLVNNEKALEEKTEFDLHHNDYFFSHADYTIREVSPTFCPALLKNGYLTTPCCFHPLLKMRPSLFFSSPSLCPFAHPLPLSTANLRIHTSLFKLPSRPRHVV